jgi:predicted Zn finger-like uncharacterized protein
MRVVCPSCDAAYDVPETVLTARPMMRCARCAHDFRPPGPPGAPPESAPPDDLPVAPWPAAREPSFAPAPDAEPGEWPMPAPPGNPPHQAELAPSAKRNQVLAGWAASAVVIVLAISLGISYRRPVMHAWPPSIRLYAVFGLNPN